MADATRPGGDRGRSGAVTHGYQIDISAGDEALTADSPRRRWGKRAERRPLRRQSRGLGTS